jgi:hypothetical protein
MTSRRSQHRSQKSRANAQPLQNFEIIASEEELDESLIATFPPVIHPRGLPSPGSALPGGNPPSAPTRKP